MFIRSCQLCIWWLDCQQWYGCRKWLGVEVVARDLGIPRQISSHSDCSRYGLPLRSLYSIHPRGSWLGLDGGGSTMMIIIMNICDCVGSLLLLIVCHLLYAVFWFFVVLLCDQTTNNKTNYILQVCNLFSPQHDVKPFYR